MIYNGVNLKVIYGSMTITKTKSQEVRHYPSTDKAERISFGKSPTTISCTLKAESVSERVEIESLLHSDVKANLEFGDMMYKDVVTGETAEPEPISPQKDYWLIGAEFIALNPVPYDKDTGEVLY